MHKVEKIMQTLLQVLRRSTKLNALTERARLHAYNLDELPAVSVRQGAEEVQTEAQTLSHYTPTFEILIDLSVKNDISFHHEEWLNKMRAEVSLLIELNPTFGLDFVIDTYELGSSEPSSADSSNEIMSQTVSYQCQYRRLRTNPEI